MRKQYFLPIWKARVYRYKTLENESKISLIKLYFVFVKIGAILLGGGYVILPILLSELAQKRRLVEESDLIEYFALSQSLPGIVAANISAFIGCRLRGFWGAVLSILGVITVPFLSIILLVAVLENLVNNRYVAGIFWGVGVAVVALIILTIREMWQKSDKNLFFYSIFFAALIGLLVFKLSPVCVIISFSIIGVIIKSVIEKRRAK